MKMPTGQSIVHLHPRRKSARCVANRSRRRQLLHCLTHLAMEAWPSPRVQEVKLSSRTPDATAAQQIRLKPYQAFGEELEHVFSELFEEWKYNERKKKMTHLLRGTRKRWHNALENLTSLCRGVTEWNCYLPSSESVSAGQNVLCTARSWKWGLTMSRCMW